MEVNVSFRKILLSFGVRPSIKSALQEGHELGRARRFGGIYHLHFQVEE
jgi:hypothetical protein